MFEDRIFRCGESSYCGDEILVANQTHTPERLRAIADAGFNGVFLAGKLRELVPGELFGKYVRKSDLRIEALRTLCRRAKRFGLGIWVCFIEPRGLPETHPFWRDNPDLRGHPTQIYDRPPDLALCSSTQQVREHLHQGAAELFRRVPLAGALLITASEATNNCWAHVLANPKRVGYAETFWDTICDCPRCGPRGPIEVVSEIIATFRDGAKSARPAAKVVAWDWSWNMYLQPPYTRLVKRLPADVALIGDMERGGIVRRAGKVRELEEYSLIYPGPSSRFRGEVKANAGRRPMWAKLQINATHELVTVPNMPMVVSLYRKFRYLRQARVRGYVATWVMGCYIDTLNVFAVNKLSGGKVVGDEQGWLRRLAREYFGENVDADGVVSGWYGFMRACRYYPVGGDNQFLYFGPINDALAYPLKPRFDGTPMGPSWLKHVIGDRLEDAATTYTLTELADLLGKTAAGWARATDVYAAALAGADHTDRRDKELGVARVVGAVFRSAANIYRWYLLRRGSRFLKPGAQGRRILADELENVRAALPLVQADRRIGYHHEGHCYMFTPAGMKRKISDLTKLLS